MFFRKFNSNRNGKKVKTSRVYLGLSILEIGKILTFEFWYDYVKSKYQYATWIQIALSFIHIKTKYIYGGVA